MIKIIVLLVLTATTAMAQTKDEQARAQRDWENRTAQYFAKLEQRKIEIWHALQSRLLTDKELDEAIKYGDDINIGNGSYRAEDKQKERLNAFLFQYRLRFEHEKLLGKECEK